MHPSPAETVICLVSLAWWKGLPTASNSYFCFQIFQTIFWPVIWSLDWVDDQGGTLPLLMNVLALHVPSQPPGGLVMRLVARVCMNWKPWGSGCKAENCPNSMLTHPNTEKPTNLALYVSNGNKLIHIERGGIKAECAQSACGSDHTSRLWATAGPGLLPLLSVESWAGQHLPQPLFWFFYSKVETIIIFSGGYCKNQREQYTRSPSTIKAT